MPELDLDARLTATQAAAYAGVSVQAIVNWRNRGHLERGPDGKYRLLDVAKAEHATRRRARRKGLPCANGNHGGGSKPPPAREDMVTATSS